VLQQFQVVVDTNDFFGRAFQVTAASYCNATATERDKPTERVSTASIGEASHKRLLRELTCLGDVTKLTLL
jgi:hypothetical protein